MILFICIMCRFVVFFVWKLLLFGLITSDKKFLFTKPIFCAAISVIIRTYGGIGINIAQIMEYYKNKRRQKTRGRGIVTEIIKLF